MHNYTAIPIVHCMRIAYLLQQNSLLPTHLQMSQTLHNPDAPYDARYKDWQCGDPDPLPAVVRLVCCDRLMPAALEHGSHRRELLRGRCHDPITA